MSAASAIQIIGNPLNEEDYAILASSGIGKGTADRALLRRVDSLTGAEMMGRNGSGDYSGILIPYIWPGDDHVREYRLRRDRPEIENGKPKNKYLSPPGRANMLYFAPGTAAEWLSDPAIPIVLVEGEKKCLAISELAWYGLSESADRPRWLSIAISGVQNWRGKIGNVFGPKGERLDEVGPITDLGRVAWKKRVAVILFDSNVNFNEQVKIARLSLAKYLRSRSAGATVLFVDIPDDAGVNGVDDLIGVWGRDHVLSLIQDEAYDPKKRDREERAKAARLDPKIASELTETTPDLVAFKLNDFGNAHRLLAIYGGDLKYCHAFRKFLVYDGMRWYVDETGRAQGLAKKTMLMFLYQVVTQNANEKYEKFATFSLRISEIKATLANYQSENFVTPAQLDTDPFLLTFKNGTIDLRTSELRPHRREDLITKLVHYDYDPDAKCPLWLSFLIQIMGGGPDADQDAQDRAKRLVEYLKRAFGYSLTGCTIEKAVFVLFGDGDNGKSTMLSTFGQLINEHSVLMQVDTLMVRQETNNAQADLADLRGARFVQTSETEEGQRLSQGKLKRITQGMGKIKAARKYENPIEFPETHKLWMDTNRKPLIRDADDAAIFNRLHAIPFTYQIPKTQIDRGMQAKLLAEGKGIVAWAVAGAKLWFESGLNKPVEVGAATEEWRSEMDQLGRFIDECCVVRDNSSAQASALFARYTRWREENGEPHTMSATAFGRKLGKRNFQKRHTTPGWLYEGIGLRAAEEDDVIAPNFCT